MLVQAAYTFCVSVLYVHAVFDDKHVLNLMCVCACIYMFTPDQAIFLYVYIYVFNLFFNTHYLLVSRYTGVHFNMNVHVLNILYLTVSLVNSSFPHGRGLDVKRPRVFSTTLVK